MYKEALRKEVVAPEELLNDLLKRGLIGVDLTIDEFYYAQELSTKYKKLSGYDRTALAIAKFRNIPLMTGDNALRKAAIKENVEVFGTIGLLDKLYQGDYINAPEYKYCLESLLSHPERRLPKELLEEKLISINKIR